MAAAAERDINSVIAALLRDMASVQTSVHSRWGYKRAAAAILALDEPVGALVQPDGSLRKIAGIGPSSSRIIHEVLLGAHLVLLVLRVLHVAGYRDGGSVLHGRLYDDAFEGLRLGCILFHK